jgi:hypothetical protein
MDQVFLFSYLVVHLYSPLGDFFLLYPSNYLVFLCVLPLVLSPHHVLPWPFTFLLLPTHIPPHLRPSLPHTQATTYKSTLATSSCFLRARFWNASDGFVLDTFYDLLLTPKTILRFVTFTGIPRLCIVLC